MRFIEWKSGLETPQRFTENILTFSPLQKKVRERSSKKAAAIIYYPLLMIFLMKVRLYISTN